MADAFSGPLDGFALWLATEGRPRSPATIRNYCLYLRQLRSYALQRGLTSWEQLTRSHMRQRRRIGRPRKQPGWMTRLDHLSPWAAAGLGIFLQPWSLVAAGAVTVLQAKLSTAGDWLALVVFCLLATSSFLVMELYAAFAPAAAGDRFERIHKWISTHQDQAIVAGSLAVGAWLLGHSIFLIVA